MEDTCPSCGEKALGKEVENGMEHLVCYECGYLGETSNLVIEASADSVYTKDIPFIAHEGISKEMLSMLKKRDSEGKLSGRKAVKNFGSRFCFSSEKMQTSLQYFDEAYENTLIKQKSIEYKQTVAAACVYITCRMTNYPITLREMASSIRVNIFLFGKVFKVVKQILNVDLPSLSLGSVTTNLLEKSNFDFKLIKDSQEIVQLCTGIWSNSTPNDYSAVVTAAVYMAWSAHNQSTNKAYFKQAAIKSFCETHHLNFRRNVYRQLTGIIESLCLLSNKIPWLSNKVDKKQLLYYLNDIIKYQRTLISEALAELKEALPSRKKRKVSKSAETGDNIAICIVHPDLDLNSEVLSVHDIPDEDIKHYIRDPQEVDYIQNCQELLKTKASS